MSLLTDFLKLFKYDPETDRDKTFNITQALNENWDKIDADKKAQDDAIATKETPAGAQAKANTAEANAKSYTDTHEQKAAPHSGHETPAGAQEKVTTHENKTSTHGATSAATANRIIIRDASGRAKVAAPSATDDIARKDTVDAVQADLDAHKADYASFKNNIEGIRYVDEKMELKINGEWVEFKSKDGYPVGNISNLSVSIGNGEVALSWQDPPDVTIEDSEGNIITIARWAGTKLVRKTGSYPAHENDGTLIVDNTVYNQYQSNGFIDDGLTNGTTYYYMLFPYTEENVVTIDSANRISATPQAYDDLTGSPGAKNLISGTMQEGFFGEVSSGELITGDALASQVGISQGTSQYSTAGWLKFAYQGKIQFVAKKPIRHSISWDAINTAKCVYGDSGDKIIEIGGLTYKVRLLRALEPSNDPKTVASAVTGTINHYSEWNRLMCQIHEQAIDKSWDYPDNVESDIGILEHDLGNGTQGMYNDADLVVKSGDGRASWCQEMGTSTSCRLRRGHDGVSFSDNLTSSGTSANYGWRPVLELVS